MSDKEEYQAMAIGICAKEGKAPRVIVLNSMGSGVVMQHSLSASAARLYGNMLLDAADAIDPSREAA